ncbi:hypothetical protein D3C87_1292970 [compost metagenome]
MAVNTPQQAMMDVKNKYQIDADFINLTKDEVAIMNNTLDFHSYPSHFLIDKSGSVINNSMQKISSKEGLEAVVKTVEKLIQ